MADYSTRAELLRWSLGNNDAFEIMRAFGHFGHVVDDFIDNDLPEDVTARSALMLSLLELCLVRLPNNAFYAKHSLSYQSVILQMLLMYDESNLMLQEADESSLALSFAFRGSEEMIYYHTAYLLGGLEHANLVRREYRELWRMSDSYEEWKEEHR